MNNPYGPPTPYPVDYVDPFVSPPALLPNPTGELRTARQWAQAAAKMFRRAWPDGRLPGDSSTRLVVRVFHTAGWSEAAVMRATSAPPARVALGATPPGGAVAASAVYPTPNESWQVITVTVERTVAAVDAATGLPVAPERAVAAALGRTFGFASRRPPVTCPVFAVNAWLGAWVATAATGIDPEGDPHFDPPSEAITWDDLWAESVAQGAPHARWCDPNTWAWWLISNMTPVDRLLERFEQTHPHLAATARAVLEEARRA